MATIVREASLPDIPKEAIALEMLEKMRSCSATAIPAGVAAALNLAKASVSPMRSVPYLFDSSLRKRMLCPYSRASWLTFLRTVRARPASRAVSINENRSPWSEVTPAPSAPAIAKAWNWMLRRAFLAPSACCRNLSARSSRRTEKERLLAIGGKDMLCQSKGYG